MPTPGETANRWITGLAAAAALALLAMQLVVPPVVGLADNGDYQRVMHNAGFEHSTDDPGERYFAFLRTRYRVLPVGAVRSGHLSSETALALAARWMSGARAGGEFDLRVLGALHAALLVLALAALIRACRGLTIPAQATAAVLGVFFFTDVGYAAPFNSFYGQTASLLFLLLTAAVAARAIRAGGLAGGWLLLYFALAAAFVASKPQEAIQGPVLALLGVGLARVPRRGALRHPASWLALGLCAFSVWYGKSTPNDLKAAALYQVVFYEILPHSPDPAADAAALGLDPAWVRYSGSEAFRPDTPLVDSEFRSRLLRAVGYRKIAAFYLARPRQLAERVARIAPKTWTLRPSYGNLERSPEHPFLTRTGRFAVWSRLRLRLFGPTAIAALAALGVLLGGTAAAALATWRRASPCGRLFREALLAAAAMSATAFAVCVLTNAPPDFSRVFYVAQALCDLLLVSVAAWIVQALASRRRGGT
jgi:hypothetical protein